MPSANAAGTHAHPAAQLLDVALVARARATRPRPAALDAAATELRALADHTRLRIVAALAAVGGLCVGDLAAVVEVSESAVSHSLRTLRQLRIVHYRKDGKVAYYALDPVWRASPLAAVLLDGPLRRGPARGRRRPTRTGAPGGTDATSAPHTANG